MGCPLRCLWCHNPESQNYDISYMFDPDKCRACGSCQGKPDYDCLSDARKAIGYDITVRELVSELEKDLLFYEDSGGGITVSGGEPLAQPESLLALLEACRDRGISVCLDTSGYTRKERDLTKEELLGIADLCDRILFDIKVLDLHKHRKYTGGELRRVLETLNLFLQSETPVEIRIPLIPDINNDWQSKEEMAAFLKSLGERYPGKPDKVTYLDYHEAGRHKYARLGKSYPMDFLMKEKK